VRLAKVLDKREEARVTKNAEIQSILYESDRERIVSLVVEMGKSASSLLENAVFAFLNHDAALARKVVEDDDLIDAMESQVDQECLGSIAMRSPAKEELYFILAVLKIITDLERIGDQAVNIAEKALRVGEKVPYPRRESLLEMLGLVKEMFKQAVGAFKNEDKNMAAALWERDDEVDALYAQCYTDFLRDAVVHPGGGVQAVETGAAELWVARHLERAGDHVINIAERVFFMVERRSFPTKDARGGLRVTPSE